MLIEKIKTLFSSIRFWIVTLTGVVAILEQLTVGSMSASFLFKVVELWMAAVVALGTFDSIASKFGAARKNV